MSKLSLLGAALRSRVSSHHPVRLLPLRRLSTETEGEQQPPAEVEQQQDHRSAAEGEGEGEQQQQQDQDPSFDPFLHGSDKGLVFGRLTGLGRNTMKTDVIHYFEGCNLSTDHVKMEYNRTYTPVGMLLQFPSRSSFDMAVRHAARKGRLFRLEMIDRSQWDLTTPYDGKTILLQGLPRDAIPDDVERFLCGSNFDASTLRIFLGYVPEPCRLALVQFPSRIDAMNALFVKNRSFCLNNPITMRVLH